MEKNKRIGILFSGGLDSTYLIWKNLKKGNEVVPIYIEIKNNYEKTQLEKNRIQLLHELFRKEFREKIHEIVHTLSIDITPSDNLKFKQIPIWILGLLYSQNHGVSELQIGYVGGDDAIGYLDDMKTVYNSFNLFNNDKLKKIKFPLIKESKYEMISKLPQEYVDLTVSCENPKIINENTRILDHIPCGQCPPCQKILITNNFHYGLSDKYKKIKLDNAFDYILYHYNKDNIEYNSDFTIIKKETPKIRPIEQSKQLQINFDFGVDMIKNEQIRLKHKE